MKIQIDTVKKQDKNKKIYPHQTFYLFVAIVAIIFATLYIHGYIEYNSIK